MMDAEQGRKKQSGLAGILRLPAPVALAIVVGFVLWAHFGSGVPVFRSEVAPEPGWEKFRARYGINYFGSDGQFVRAVQNGYNLFFHTHKYGQRFTRKNAGDRLNSC